jgi:hypothetical protein
MKHSMFALVVMLTSSVAQGAPGFRLQADGVCDGAGVASRVTALNGKDLFDADATDRVRVHSRSEDGEIRAEVTITTADGVVFGPRHLAASDCTQLVEALVVVIATSVRTIGESTTPPPVAPVEIEAGRDLELRASAPDRSRELDLLAGIAGSVSQASTQTGVTMGIRGRRGNKSLGVELQLDMPSPLKLPDGMSQLVVSRVMFDALPCVHVGPASGCAIVAAGWISGYGVGLAADSPARMPTVEVGVGLGVEHALTHRISVRARTDARALLVETRFLVDSLPVWSSGRFEGRLGFDVIARIP